MAASLVEYCKNIEDAEERVAKVMKILNQSIFSALPNDSNAATLWMGQAPSHQLPAHLRAMVEILSRHFVTTGNFTIAEFCDVVGAELQLDWVALREEWLQKVFSRLVEWPHALNYHSQDFALTTALLSADAARVLNGPLENQFYTQMPDFAFVEGRQVRYCTYEGWESVFRCWKKLSCMNEFAQEEVDKRIRYALLLHGHTRKPTGLLANLPGIGLSYSKEARASIRSYRALEKERKVLRKRMSRATATETEPLQQAYTQITLALQLHPAAIVRGLSFRLALVSFS
jgi:hypothetical protein